MCWVRVKDNHVEEFLVCFFPLFMQSFSKDGVCVVSLMW